MADWYSSYYKDRNKSSSYKGSVSRPKQPLISKEKQVKLTKEFIQEVVKTNPPKPTASRYLDYRKNELDKTVDSSFNHPREKPVMPVQNIITPEKQQKFQPYYSKPYYPSYSREKLQAEEVEPEYKKPKPDPYQVLAEVQGKIKPEFNKKLLIVTVIIILLLIGGIFLYYFLNSRQSITNPSGNSVLNTSQVSDSTLLLNEVKFSPVDIITVDSSADSVVSYNGNNIMMLSGEESKLEYDNDLKRLYTSDLKNTSDKGWITDPAMVTDKIKNSNSEKQITISMGSDSEIKNASFVYYVFKDKPYFKVKFSVNAENLSKLGDFEYGMISKDYDVYSQSGDVYVNNHGTIPMLNKTVGSSYTDDSDYQIFVNKNKTQAVVLYTPYLIAFQDSFLNNIYLINVLQMDESDYAPLYVIIIDNPKLTFDKAAQDWKLDSSQYQGSVMSYIDDVMNEFGDN